MLRVRRHLSNKGVLRILLVRITAPASCHISTPLGPFQTSYRSLKIRQSYKDSRDKQRIEAAQQVEYARSIARKPNSGYQQQADSDVPENEAIRSFKVHIVQSDGKLGEPELLFDALARRKKDEKGRYLEVLRQVQGTNAKLYFPVCRSFDIREEQLRDLAQKKADKLEKRTLKTPSKRLEYNWTIGDNDLGHRLGKLKELLEKGRKVEVVIGGSRKRGWRMKRTDDLQVAQQLVSKTKSAALDVDGAKEAYEMRGEMGQQLEMCFEGPRRRNDSASS